MAVEVRRGGRRRDGGTVGVFGAGDEDPLHRAIARIADVDRPPAGGVETLDAVAVGETDDALSGTQPVQGVDLQQETDQLGHVRGRARRLGDGTTPGCA